MTSNFEFKKKKILVTGGTGFLGRPLISSLLERGAVIRTIARNEGKLLELQQEFPSIEIFTGDIADNFNCRSAMRGVDAVFHLAAFKHVGMAEIQSRACTTSNIIGSLNLLETALMKEHVELMIGISTDKAAQVSGVYGASKLVMERLFAEYEKMNPLTKHRIVRYGNVLYSTGSVLCKWKALLQEGKQLTVTDPSATRFFWTVDQAIDLIYQCIEHSTDCTPWLPTMKSMKIGDLLTAMHQVYGIRDELDIKIIGLQPGENLHEKILEGGQFSNEVEQYTVDEIMKLI